MTSLLSPATAKAILLEREASVGSYPTSVEHYYFPPFSLKNLFYNDFKESTARAQIIGKDLPRLDREELEGNWGEEEEEVILLEAAETVRN